MPLGEKKKPGRPCKYLQMTEWYRWLANDFAHLQNDVRWIKMISVGLLIGILIKILLDFFYG